MLVFSLGVFYTEVMVNKQACNEFVVFSSVTIASLLAGWLNTTIGWYQLNLVTIPFILVIIAALFIFKPQLKPSLQHK